MRAVVQSEYGAPAEVLSVVERPEPVPSDDEVLVRVRAASVHPDVWHVVTGRPAMLRLMGSGLRRPQPDVPGTDLAGVVEAVGAGVTQLRVGDEVFGESIRGMQWRNGATWAELAVAPASGLVPKPSDVSFDAAAAVPTPGLIVLQNLPPEGELAGRRVLVNGAAGGVGSLALQVLVADGAAVTAVDRPEVLDQLRSLGAAEVVDFTTHDATRLEARFDLVFDVPGNHPFSAWRRVLAERGRYVLIGHDGYGRSSAGPLIGSMRKMLPLVLRAPVSPHLQLGTTKVSKVDGLARFAALMADGRLHVPVERTYGLDQAAEALDHLATGRAEGRVVLAP